MILVFAVISGIKLKVIKFCVIISGLNKQTI